MQIKNVVARFLYLALALCAAAALCAALTGCGCKAEQEEPQQEEQANEQAASTQEPALTICIDAGHGGATDSTLESTNPYGEGAGAVEPGGASGELSGTEAQVNLDVALYLRDALQQQGVEVVMVREDNSTTIGCIARAECANSCDADLFIRLHCDSAGSSTRGFYTLMPGDAGYQSDNEMYLKSQVLSRSMHMAIVESLGCNDRGMDIRSDLGGFNWCKVPCVLFEMGNMDNAEDDAQLASSSYKQQLANAIADAAIAALA